jgi:prepilin-type N-terminal cleavage/methylation domain-containing protein
MPDRKQAQGFTLVEIAIVLVIIGLLLGGILKGQELIKSARVRNLADQNSAVQAAYYGFIDRYRQVPGDLQGAAACNLIGPNLTGCGGAGGAAGTGPGGNGDGKIGGGINDLPEATALWAHLAAAGFISGGYPGVTPDVANYKTAQPAVAPPNAFNGRLVLAQTAAYQQAANAPTVRLNLALGHYIPASIARELDTKLDDGQPQTGIVRAAATPGSGGALGDLVEVGAATCTAAGAAGAGAAWNIVADDPDCNAVFLY